MGALYPSPNGAYSIFALVTTVPPAQREIELLKEPDKTILSTLHISDASDADIAWSPDSHYVGISALNVYTEHSQVFRVSPAGLTPSGLPAASYLNIQEPETTSAPSVAWSPDARHVAIAAALQDGQGMIVASLTSAGFRLVKTPSLEIQKFMTDKTIPRNARLYSQSVTPITWESTDSLLCNLTAQAQLLAANSESNHVFPTEAYLSINRQVRLQFVKNGDITVSAIGKPQLDEH